MFRAILLGLCLNSCVAAAEPLRARIDALVLAKSKGRPVSAPAADGEFLRRAYLDLVGTIPTAAEARAFLADTSPGKRTALIDRLLRDPRHAERMASLFDVMLMERLGENEAWRAYLSKSFAENKPFDRMAREVLRASPDEAAPKGAAYFVAKRLENYGQNPVDHPALARDVGRLFLGRDLRCAQCHDHLFVKDYKQADFQGLFAFVRELSLAGEGRVAEKHPGTKVEFVSVFVEGKKMTLPRVPGRPEIAVPTFEKGKEYHPLPGGKKGNGPPRFSPLEALAKEVTASPDFARNAVNRLWWALMGRGLVHPLDLHHSANPASHPEVLDLLAKEFAASGYDVRAMVRELALTDVYGRSSRLPEGVTKFEPERFLTAVEKRLSAEQLLWATLEATGERERVVKESSGPPVTAAKGKVLPTPLNQARAAFTKAFAGPAREAEEAFAPSLEGALFVSNDATVQSWLTARPGNLVGRLSAMADDGKVAEEAYLSVLTRRPDADEAALVRESLAGKTGKERPRAVGRVVWALMAGTEFAVNH